METWKQKEEMLYKRHTQIEKDKCVTTEKTQKRFYSLHTMYNTDIAQDIAEKSVSWNLIFIIYGGGLEWEWLP